MELIAQEPTGWNLEEARDMCLRSALDIPMTALESLFQALTPFSRMTNDRLELQSGAKLVLDLPAFHLACRER